jgi:hypothetical protein
VRSLVIFLAMMYSCRAMSVRGEIVEFGGSLMGVVRHGVSFRTIDNPADHPESLGTTFQRNLAANGSFQAAKLQRSARTTVCSHSTRDMAAMRSIKSQHHYSDTQDEFLSGCGQCKSASFKIVPHETFLAFASVLRKRGPDCLNCWEHFSRL